ncbi:porin family protein [Prevotella intermedia]|uniref:Outer membrane protein beta-barrel domain-containing protein n=1 Tax=Prevotella intermedia TaxID=28131 RepID=A0A2D3L9Y1_PREIN|nr:porin family protein [Prevotella intermedia]ATV27365.1 hypothetical protein CTM62_11420 [Prevotella intermedia]
MKKIILTAAIMLASVGAYAQFAVGSINLQPKVGLNISNITDIDGADPHIGLAAGLEAEYQVSDIFSLSAGAIYSQQGTKLSWVRGGVDVAQTLKLDYINVPILANVYVAKGLAVKLGVQPGFNVTAKLEHKETAAGRTRKTTGDVEDVKSVDFSIPVGLSYEYANFQLDARYNWGVSKVADDDDEKNSVFQITLGYKFKL